MPESSKKRKSSPEPMGSSKKGPATRSHTLNAAGQREAVAATGSGNQLALPTTPVRAGAAGAAGVNSVGVSNSSISPYADSYQHDGSASKKGPHRSGLRMCNVPIEDAGLVLPGAPGSAEYQAAYAKLKKECEQQASNPPMLPESKIEDLPEKEVLEPYIDIPENASPEFVQEARQKNTEIAVKHKLGDKQRNNLAAKKSRETRLETIDNQAQLINRQHLQLLWQRAQLLLLGKDPDGFQKLKPEVVSRGIDCIENQVKAQEQQRAELKKRKHSETRSARDKKKAELKRAQNEELAIRSPAFAVQSRKKVTKTRRSRTPKTPQNGGDDSMDETPSSAPTHGRTPAASSTPGMAPIAIARPSSSFRPSASGPFTSAARPITGHQIPGHTLSPATPTPVRGNMRYRGPVFGPPLAQVNQFAGAPVVSRPQYSAPMVPFSAPQMQFSAPQMPQMPPALAYTSNQPTYGMGQQSNAFRNAFNTMANTMPMSQSMSYMDPSGGFDFDPFSSNLVNDSEGNFATGVEDMESQSMNKNAEQDQ